MRETLRTEREQTVMDPFNLYLRDCAEVPLLNAEEERKLADRVREGDPEAREHFIRANLRLVVNIARDYSGRGVPLEDLIQEGNIGLMRAVEGFDTAQKTRFSTYASYWIKQKIKRAILNTSKTVREPSWFHTFRKKWNSAIHALTTPDGLLPTEKQVQTYLNVSDKFIRTYRCMLLQCTTHENEYLANDESGEVEFESLLPGIREDPSLPVQHREEIDILDKALHFIDTKEKIRILEHFGLHDTNSPSLDAETPLVIAILHEALLSLDARERTVIMERFGLRADGESKTLAKIGESLGVTRERVRQIEREALQKLRNTMCRDEKMEQPCPPSCDEPQKIPMAQFVSSSVHMGSEGGQCIRMGPSTVKPPPPDEAEDEAIDFTAQKKDGVAESAINMDDTLVVKRDIPLENEKPALLQVEEAFLPPDTRNLLQQYFKVDENELLAFINPLQEMYAHVLKANNSGALGGENATDSISQWRENLLRIGFQKLLFLRMSRKGSQQFSSTKFALEMQLYLAQEQRTLQEKLLEERLSDVASPGDTQATKERIGFCRAAIVALKTFARSKPSC